MARTPLNENCLAVILNKLPKKLGDPGQFLIPCEFSGINTCNSLADLGASINLMPYSVWKNLSLPKLTPTCMTLELADRSISEPIGVAEDVYVTVGNDFLLFEEADSFLAIEDDPTSPEVDPTYYDPDGDILLLEAILNSDPSPPPPNQGNYFPETRKDLKICEANSSVNEPPEVELKDLPPHLEYAFLEGNDKLPVIIAKDLKNEEKAALIEVLKSHKRAIAWKLSDIKGIDPEFCTHKILMEEDYEPTVQHQRRVNPKIHDVIKKEVEKLLDAGLIYPISDSPWDNDDDKINIEHSLGDLSVKPLPDVINTDVGAYAHGKRISDKRTKNQVKNDKTEHGMEKRGKDKVKSKPKTKKVKVKSQPTKVNSPNRADIEEYLMGPPEPI
ncbi:reverse transcriptase domain-containing protein [Tanacetum coccineum]|uniref:Reverse transcriptase domain-containing protein n=1 Tax=Tanacetum coccineum TaxID=301880 RepID=A0ABQ4XTZ9_9ASTR